jgi:succinyl-diaminopimelate desuccinylase
MSTLIDLCKNLIQRQSITPEDAGCQPLIAEKLEAMDFTVEHIPFADVKNLWARYGDNNPLFVFLGHTDVVPPGPVDEWTSDPFKPEIRDDFLYGRGAADMKTGIAAMLSACQRFLKDHPKPAFSIAFMITSDEEAQAINGTKKLINYLTHRNERITWCLVGEPSSRKKAGDIIKVGRRGSLHGFLRIFGTQGHIAYMDPAKNPIHQSFKALDELAQQNWDFKPNPHFPPTTMQVSNLHAGVGADNVVPGEMDVMFNLRYSTATTAEHIQQVAEAVLDKHKIKYRLDWRVSGKPFLTNNGKLLDAAKAATLTVTGQEAELSTTGGTSDGRFIAPTGAEVIELGVCNHSIHQVDECVAIEDIEQLEKMYYALLCNLEADVAGNKKT